MDAGVASKRGLAMSGDGGGGGAPAQFPAGLRVLVVDDDPTCLKIIEKMLRSCQYDVTTCTRAMVALAILREKKGGYDVVLSDVHMPDVDGFKLLECIGLEMDLPVIMMSADDGKDVVMKGVTHGACDYLIKPVRMDALQNIWQHVVRRHKKPQLNEQAESMEGNDRQRIQGDDGDHSSSGNEGCWKSVKRRMDGKEEEDEVEQREDPSTLKKPRVVWSVELHQQFVSAVNQLGVDKAVPKKILELMDVPGLTRENVASHLQKYRLYLKRVSAQQQQQNRVDTNFTGSSDGGHSPMSSIHGYSLQTLAASGQLPQNLTNLQAVPRRGANSGLGYTSGPEWGNEAINLIHPADIKHKHSQQMLQQYATMGVQANGGTSGFLDPLPSFGTGSSFHGGMITGQQRNSMIMHMTQQGQQCSLLQQQNNSQIATPQIPLSKGQILNGIAAERNSRLSATIGQQVLSDSISGTFFGRDGPIVGGGTSLPAACYPQNLYAGFPISCNESIGESIGDFSLLGNIASSSPKSTAMFQESVPIVGNLETFNTITNSKDVNDFTPSYDIVSELHQSRSQGRKLQNIDVSYESVQQLSSKPCLIDFSAPLPSRPDVLATIADGNSRNTCTVSKEIFSVQRSKVECIAQHNSTVLVENSVTVTQSMPNLSCGDPLFANDMIPDGFMNIISNQSDGVGEVDSSFTMESYSFDDILA